MKYILINSHRQVDGLSMFKIDDNDRFEILSCWEKRNQSILIDVRIGDVYYNNYKVFVERMDRRLSYKNDVLPEFEREL